jgi:hypothetical protein
MIEYVTGLAEPAEIGPHRSRGAAVRRGMVAARFGQMLFTDDGNPMACGSTWAASDSTAGWGGTP